ncbi:MAG: ABC-F type ribosomal protection protein [Lachnospiraceae bacterium]|nr:ABC-F type ribosomal protection protein [Lachnospiraceae bacterium]
MILACDNIKKSFGTDVILDGAGFHVNENEKVAIVGDNGCGKSTLLKIIMREMSADEGNVVLAKNATIGYLAQHQEIDSTNTIYDEVLEVKKDVIDLYHQIRTLELEMKTASGQDLDRMLSLYTRLNSEFEMKNGYAYKSEVTGVLKGLGFREEEFDTKAATLSGGQKTRLALGKLLIMNPDIILLDEPINHLDMASITWLETYLLNYKGAVVIVAHDRYFLDRIVQKVVEIENGKTREYVGNYTEFAKKKELLRNARMKQYYKQQQEVKHQQEVIQKLKSFNREKSIKRAESREKMLSKVELIDKPVDVQNEMSLRLEPGIVSGKDVLEVNGLSKAFGSNHLLEGVDFDLKRGERVAIIGNNGTGKTTILKMINELLPADAGTITLGTNVHIGYYDQEQQTMDPEKTLFEEISDTYPDMDNTRIRNVLAAFLFTGDDVYKQIKSLSGGEKGRISLAKLMLSEANLLILDEPTNHLDITSKEILEDALNHYTGTVLYVSHDRYFINRTATRVLNLNHKKLYNYIGNYDYYLEKKEFVEGSVDGGEAVLSRDADRTTNDSAGKKDWKQQKEEAARLRKIQNDLSKCEKRIEEIETRLGEIDQLLLEEEVYTNVPKLMEMNKEKTALEEELEQCMEEWESLSELT